MRWQTNQPDVIEINGIFSEAGIEYDEQDSISVRLKALNPGTAKIHADFTTSTGSYTCFVEITVFKLLELDLPRRITGDAIIVPPRSQINLKANLPDARFHVAEETTSGLRVSPDGVLRTTDHIGRDLVVVSIFLAKKIFVAKRRKVGVSVEERRVAVKCRISEEKRTEVKRKEKNLELKPKIDLNIKQTLTLN